MNNPRNPDIVTLPVEFHAMKDHVVAVFHIGKIGTVGLRFLSPHHMLEFFVGMMEKAATVWPNDPYIKEYLDNNRGSDDLSKRT